jgi:CheY-like chemotaxis protein
MARLLIVDDLEFGRQWLRGILEAAGHVVIEARNGHDALSIVEAGGFDLVVTDIVMPRMSGVELIKRLRSAGGQKAKVLAISAGAKELPSDLGLQLGHAVGADGILYLPCRPAELLKAVDALLAE